MTDELLTVDDVARITQLSVFTVRAAVRACELPATKIRGRIRIAPADLADWIEEGRIKPPPAPFAGEFRAPPPRQPPPGSAREAVKRLRRDAR